ncbi:hypothetical protein C9J01_08130 [Photobacterium rosenbergii]|uniref:Uncharacterized protein n=1 Tax=Photobacterium rosenbergii TaxID=294936 RepID=A0A2T3NH99_9GAMM|nr:hypothetical protein [Photobacterium rosenbergii]PSW14396.1 hypothetical protein C9J01_08130 [Photobacterium rosenbergii]
MGNAARKLEQSYPRPASESLAHCHELLNCKSLAGLSYENLDESVKRTLCFSAGLKQRHIPMKLHELTPFERKKLHQAINTLADALKPLAYRSLKEFR